MSYLLKHFPIKGNCPNCEGRGSGCFFDESIDPCGFCDGGFMNSYQYKKWKERFNEEGDFRDANKWYKMRTKKLKQRNDKRLKRWCE